MMVANKLTPEPILRCFYNQKKARQALGKSRKFVKTTIYKNRVVYLAHMEARQALDKSRKFVKTMIYKYRVVLHNAIKSMTNT